MVGSRQWGTMCCRCDSHHTRHLRKRFIWCNKPTHQTRCKLFFWLFFCAMAQSIVIFFTAAMCVPTSSPCAWNTLLLFIFSLRFPADSYIKLTLTTSILENTRCLFTRCQCLSSSYTLSAALSIKVVATTSKSYVTVALLFLLFPSRSNVRLRCDSVGLCVMPCELQYSHNFPHVLFLFLVPCLTQFCVLVTFLICCVVFLPSSVLGKLPMAKDHCCSGDRCREASFFPFF